MRDCDAHEIIDKMLRLPLKEKRTRLEEAAVAAARKFEEEYYRIDSVLKIYPPMRDFIEERTSITIVYHNGENLCEAVICIREGAGVRLPSRIYLDKIDSPHAREFGAKVREFNEFEERFYLARNELFRELKPLTLKELRKSWKEAADILTRDDNTDITAAKSLIQEVLNGR